MSQFVRLAKSRTFPSRYAIAFVPVVFALWSCGGGGGGGNTTPPPVPQLQIGSVAESSPTAVLQGAPVTFTATCSGGQPPYSYQWTFGDGSAQVTTSSGTTNHVFVLTGSLNVAASCTDARNVNVPSAQPAFITVTAPPPAIGALGFAPTNPLGGAPVNFSVACTDPTASLLSYTWNFGDGTGGTSATGSISHTYVTAGSFSASVSCTDVGHGVSSTSSATVAVGVAPPGIGTPIALSGNAVINWPASLTVACTGSTTTGWSYSWSFGDGSPVLLTSSPQGSHVYSSAGTYAVSVSCDDGSGVPASSSTNITVSNSSPSLSLVAGMAGYSGYADLNGPLARFSGPLGIARDGLGNVYVADAGNHAIRKIASTGAVSTLAGGSGSGYADGTGAAALFHRPWGVASDSQGTVYVADGNQVIRKITLAGVVTTIAGTPNVSGSADGQGSSATFSAFRGLAIDAAGTTLYVADGNAIRSVTTTGLVTTIAGVSGTSGSTDGTGAAARFNSPWDVAVDASGVLWVADTNNCTIRRIASGGVVTTFAGVAGACGSLDGTGSAARFYLPASISVDASGNLYIGDTYQGGMIRKLTTSGAVATTVAGSAFWGHSDGMGSAASFDYPTAIASDPSGNLVVAEEANSDIRYVTTGAIVTTLAGRGNNAGCTDGSGSTAQFSGPAALAVDASGNLYVADGYYTVRKVTSAGVVTTLAGSCGRFGTADGTGSAARFGGPASGIAGGPLSGIAADAAGNLYVTDSLAYTVRKISPAGVVTTLAGSGAPGSADGTGSAASFYGSLGIAVDSSGNVFVADSLNFTIRKITPAGVVSTFAGSTGSSSLVDGNGTAAHFRSPGPMVIDASDNLYLLDGYSSLRKITPGAVVTTVANNLPSPPLGLGVGPVGLALDSSGNIYVSVAGASQVVRLTSAGAVASVLSVANRSGFAPGATPALLNSPSGLAVYGTSLYLLDSHENVLGVAGPLP